MMDGGGSFKGERDDVPSNDLVVPPGGRPDPVRRLPRACALHEGQAGLCFVRRRADDRIVLTTYGRSSGFCVDPSRRSRSTTSCRARPCCQFGTAGCNLGVPVLSELGHLEVPRDGHAGGCRCARGHRRGGQRLGCRSVAFTYNDP